MPCTKMCFVRFVEWFQCDRLRRQYAYDIDVSPSEINNPIQVLCDISLTILITSIVLIYLRRFANKRMARNVMDCNGTKEKKIDVFVIVSICKWCWLIKTKKYLNWAHNLTQHFFFFSFFQPKSETLTNLI